MTLYEKKFSVLFVDDEEKALKYFSRLYSEDFDILTASSVAAARDILSDKADSIGVLITDQRMPEEKGVDLLKHMRREYPHIIRLLTTAYSDLSDAIEAVNTGEILRYITKPWDVDSLRMELTNAMQFFLLRQERDQLLREKLNVRQRLLDVNRLRDLLILSSGYTHIRHSQLAIASLLARTRFSHSSGMAQLEQLDTWALLKKEIGSVLGINEKLVQETFVGDADNFTSQPVSTILSRLDGDANTKIEAPSDGTVSANAELLTKLLTSLVSLLRSLSSEQAEIVVTAATSADEIHFQLRCDQADWHSITLLTCPPELLISFLICYHHGGKMEINTDSGIQFGIFLPDDPLARTLTSFDDELLDEIFESYDIWQE